MRSQLHDHKKELGDTSDSILSQELEESNELISLQTWLEREQFDCSLKIKKLLFASHPHDLTPKPVNNKGVKLPKIDVPKFDGNLVNWHTFWEQFSISIHSRSSLSDSEKLVYLCHSLKDDSYHWRTITLRRVLCRGDWESKSTLWPTAPYLPIVL